MARVRAIEGGFTVLRPVRGAASGAFDAYGRTRAALPFFEENTRVFVTAVPTERVPTLYARIGDAPALGYGAYLVLALVAALRRRALSAPASTRTSSVVCPRDVVETLPQRADERRLSLRRLRLQVALVLPSQPPLPQRRHDGVYVRAAGSGKLEFRDALPAADVALRIGHLSVEPAVTSFYGGRDADR